MFGGVLVVTWNEANAFTDKLLLSGAMLSSAAIAVCFQREQWQFWPDRIVHRRLFGTKSWSVDRLDDISTDGTVLRLHIRGGKVVEVQPGTYQPEELLRILYEKYGIE